jgi:NAD(P)-dependent dehydrogenase (short-subunit alcohol dehydrogenase family)
MPNAIVTGGNSGTGRAIAVTLAQVGWDVGLTWHAEAERAESALEEIGRHGGRDRPDRRVPRRRGRLVPDRRVDRGGRRLRLIAAQYQ